MKKENEVRFFITDIVAIPIIRTRKKTEQYKLVTKPGWGVLEWYSASNDYKAPVNRDKDDKTQELACDEDSSAILIDKWGRAACIFPYDEINPKEWPKQAECKLIIQSDSCGFSFWCEKDDDVQLFVTYDENGWIDTYRLADWTEKPYDGEVAIKFEDLPTKDPYSRF